MLYATSCSNFRFESLCTRQPDVDATSEFGSVLHVHLGDHRMIMAAEIDCFDPEYQGGDDPVAGYVELKTHRTPRSQGAVATLYGVKYARWWVQSWLAGVRRIAVGAWEADVRGAWWCMYVLRIIRLLVWSTC